MRTDKNMVNLEIAELLRAVAVAYELKNEEKYRFKIIAYSRAADAVEHLSSEIKDLWDEGKLEEVPGVGKSIAGHLDELFRTGKSKHFENLMKEIPPAVFELTALPGIGAKTAQKLVKELKLASSKKIFEDVQKAGQKGKIAGVEGFGEQSQADILRTIAEAKRKVKRYLLPYAQTIADEIIKWLKAQKFVSRADALGSLRRKASTVGDIDIAIATDKPQDALQRFTEYPKTVRVLEKGSRTASIILPGNIQVDLMVEEPSSYGSLLQHFTGSKHHNIALREYAKNLKPTLSLSEYGIKNLETKKLKKLKTEEEFYNFLGLEWIPPELREDNGEIEVSIEHKIPKLIQILDVKADLQIHSDFNVETSHDLGESSIQAMIQKASELGYEYLAFTEHNPSRSMHTDVQTIDILKRKKEAIEKINYSLVKDVKNGVRKVFNSLEIDILPDGNLAVSDKALEQLDFALVSIHSGFKQSRNQATNRVLNAFNHPKVKIFAHPTGRKLNQREGVEYNWPEIFEACLKRNIWLEINADPMRLDLPDFIAREAVQKNVWLSLGTDAHHKDNLDNMRWGVDVARRGWARKDNIVNCLCLKEFEEKLKVV